MTGDFTSVPLRASDRWTAARMQQGRVLLDTDWNLVIDGAAREVAALARDTIGPAGVPAGSSAFQVAYLGGVLTIRAGTMWIGGMLARNPVDLAYSAQPGIAALPGAGLAALHLDAFIEEVQAAEDPASLLDPALDGVDTTTRTRVGWRVRAVPTQSAACAAPTAPTLSTGRLDVVRTAAPVPADPCAPPDDPRSKLPDGLLRIEVVDGGTAATARFAWSYAGGGDAVAATVAGTAVTLAPSRAVQFANGDLVEVSTLDRRADRRDHGPLIPVTVTPSAGGDLITLATPSPVAGNPPGTCLRRWDGQVVGAAAAVPLTLAGADVGIAFTARPGNYLVGDWWGVRVRGSAGDAVQTLTNAPPDGTVHASAPLAVVNVTSQQVTDCRRFFPPLTELRGGTCTVTAFPGDDLQAALDRIPVDGGELCLAAGTFAVPEPLRIVGKRRIVITGVGPATVLAAVKHEAVLVATACPDIEVTNLRVEAARPGDPPGDEHLLGALSFLGCDRAQVHDTQIWCPDSSGRAQSGIYAAPDRRGNPPGEVEIRGNRLEVGALQTGVLIVSADRSTVVDNTVVLSPGKPSRDVDRLVARELGRFVATHLSARGDGDRLTLPNERALNITGPTEIRRLAADWAAGTTFRALRRRATPAAALARFVAAATLEPPGARVGRSSAEFLAAAVRDTRTIGQGIIVAGQRAGLVRIEGNEISRALQGIHVGLSGPGVERAALAQVVIGNNTVVCSVPFFWQRSRHAAYVGNFASLTMTDNHAQLIRTGAGRVATRVDAVWVIGSFGRYLQVHGLDITGPFRVGLRLHNQSMPPAPALHHVSDVLNPSGAALSILQGTIPHDRCLP